MWVTRFLKGLGIGKARRFRRTLIVSAALLVGVLLLYVFRAPLLTGVAKALIVNDDNGQADVIVVLNGAEEQRAIRTAELFAAGLAPRVVIARAKSQPSVLLGVSASSTDVAVALMVRLGVPRDSITIVSSSRGVASTRDEAVSIGDYIVRQDLGSVLLVTSALHTRRARWIFQKVLSDWDGELMTVAVPHEGFDEKSWWRGERGLVAVNNEYIKLLFYWFSY